MAKKSFVYFLIVLVCYCLFSVQSVSHCYCDNTNIMSLTLLCHYVTTSLSILIDVVEMVVEVVMMAFLIIRKMCCSMPFENGLNANVCKSHATMPSAI